MSKTLVKLAVALALILGASSNLKAQDFYKGKVVRFIVGFPAGGGYDTYTRLLGRHLPKHIPGRPAIIVENMSGAGSMISANYMFRAAKADGLTVGHFIGGLFLQQLLGKPGIEFDARRFEFVGAPAQDNFIVGVSKASGVTSYEQWQSSKTMVKFGGAGFGAGTDDIPATVRAVLGLPIQLVAGYTGTADIRLAFNSGEIHGIGNSWQSTRSTWRKELDSGELRLILQAAVTSHRELTKVPLAGDLVKNQEGKKILQTVAQVHGASVRPYVLPPNTPKDRVQLLRKAFADTIKDPEFLAEAQKGNLEINPVFGEELSKSVSEVLQLEAPLVAKLKDILK